MKVSHGPIAYGASRCKDARAREVRSMERRVRGEEKKRSKDDGVEDGGRVLIRRRKEKRCSGG